MIILNTYVVIIIRNAYGFRSSVRGDKKKDDSNKRLD